MERRSEGESSRSYKAKDAKRRRLSDESVGQSWESTQEISNSNRINKLKQSFPDIKISDIEESVRVTSYKEKEECDIHDINIGEGTIDNIMSELGEVNDWSYPDRAFGYLLLALKGKNKTLADFNLTNVDHFRVSNPVAHERITTLLGDEGELTFKANSEGFKTLVDTEPGKVISELVALYSREAGRNMKITSISPYKYGYEGTVNFSCQIEKQNN